MYLHLNLELLERLRASAPSTEYGKSTLYRSPENVYADYQLVVILPVHHKIRHRCK